MTVTNRPWWLIAVAVALLTSPARAGNPQEEIRQQVPAALEILNRWHADTPQPGVRRLCVVYWTPADREPTPQYRERLSRILLDIRDFYAREMERLGFGPRTIQLETADDGLLRIHLVKGQQPYDKYEVQSGGAIRRECLPVLRDAGIDPEHETLVLFCNMSNWDPQAGTINQNSPYYASGNQAGGTAWQVDSPLLDLNRLTDREHRVRDGQYGNISIGRYNTIFIGGIAHELGHALGLPHNAARPDERQLFGTALMGAGNQTYGEDRRQEGRGTFLTLAHGLRLASHPMFSGSIKGIQLPTRAQLHDLALQPADKTFTVAGRVTAEPPAYAVLGYLDPDGGGDYDATTCTAIPDAEGRFVLNCTALRPGAESQLRIVVLQAHGGATEANRWAFPYRVAADGTVDINTARAVLELEPLLRMVEREDRPAAEALLKEQRPAYEKSQIFSIAQELVAALKDQSGPSPAEAEGETCDLSTAKTEMARVGWGRPVANRLREAPVLLLSGGEIFARGLYAHAPSRYAWRLGKKYTQLKARAGLADGHPGSVVFVVLGDDRELWRSERITAGKPVVVDVKIAGVERLELRVENADDGSGGDWALWLNPQLQRKEATTK